MLKVWLKMGVRINVERNGRIYGTGQMIFFPPRERVL